jgi:hypothetical protein
MSIEVQTGAWGNEKSHPLFSEWDFDLFATALAGATQHFDGAVIWAKSPFAGRCFLNSLQHRPGTTPATGNTDRHNV